MTLLIVYLTFSTGKGIAYDVRINLPTATSLYSAPSNVRTFLGTGATVSNTYSGGVLTVASLAGATERKGADATGANVLIVVYDVTLLDAFGAALAANPYAAQVPAQLTRYTAVNTPSALNYVTSLHASGQYSTACTQAKTITISGVPPVVATAMSSADTCTIDPDVTIGEPFQLNSTLTLPRGTLTGAVYVLTQQTTNTKTMKLINMTVVTMPGTAS